MLSFPQNMARFDLLCIYYQLIHTHDIFPGGNGQGYLEEAGSIGGDKGYMKLNPAGQDAAGSVCMEAAMLGMYKTGRNQKCVGGGGRVRRN